MTLASQTKYKDIKMLQIKSESESEPEPEYPQGGFECYSFLFNKF